jgi:DNA-binding PadR family transcriptional regulator
MKLTREKMIQAIKDTEPNCYALTLRDRLHELGVRNLGVLPLSLGQVYMEIEKLEDAGLIRTHLVPGGPERGHHPKRMIELTKPANAA